MIKTMEPGSIPDCGTKTLQAMQFGQKKKKKGEGHGGGKMND